MKNLVLPLAAMAAILVFSLWTGRYVQRQTGDWGELLSQAAQAAAEGDWTLAEKRLSQAREGWERREAFFHTIMEHGELNEDALTIILNQVRKPDWNRADLNGLVAACRTAGRRSHAASAGHAVIRGGFGGTATSGSAARCR